MCPSEQALPWSETSLVTYSGTYPQTAAHDWQQSTSSQAPMSPDKGLSARQERPEEESSAMSGGASIPGDKDEHIQSQDSFETATSQGYRTEEDDAQEFSIAMVRLGWMNEE